MSCRAQREENVCYISYYLYTISSRAQREENLRGPEGGRAISESIISSDVGLSQHERLYHNKSTRSHQKVIHSGKIDDFSRFGGIIYENERFSRQEFSCSHQKVHSSLKMSDFPRLCPLQTPPWQPGIPDSGILDLPKCS